MFFEGHDSEILIVKWTADKEFINLAAFTFEVVHFPDLKLKIQEIVLRNSLLTNIRVQLSPRKKKWKAMEKIKKTQIFSRQS